MAASLEIELATFNRELNSLMSQSGKFALISGENVLSTWSTYEDAIQEGYKICGLDHRFLVKKIEAFPRVLFNSRSVEPICRP